MDTEKADGLPINPVLISACLTGVLNGSAPLVPESLRFACILGVTRLWMASVVLWVGTTISQLSQTSIRSGTRAVLAVAAFAFVVVAIASVQLEVIRWSPAYRGLKRLQASLRLLKISVEWSASVRSSCFSWSRAATRCT